VRLQKTRNFFEEDATRTLQVGETWKRLIADLKRKFHDVPVGLADRKTLGCFRTLERSQLELAGRFSFVPGGL
jgi:hypothetical protein